MPLVTISAPYGAGGGAIAPDVARRLGVPFLDRAIAGEVADRLHLSTEQVLEREETLGAGRPIGRLLAAMGSVGAMLGAASPDPGAEGEAADEQAFVREAERVVRDRADSGQGVILGRGAALMLAGHVGALHVRLDGPPEARARQAARAASIGRDEAERRRRANDEARQAYVRHFFGVDPRDPGLYHIVLDTTVLDWDLCAEMIARAARSLSPDR